MTYVRMGCGTIRRGIRFESGPIGFVRMDGMLRTEISSIFTLPSANLVTPFKVLQNAKNMGKFLGYGITLAKGENDDGKGNRD